MWGGEGKDLLRLQVLGYKSIQEATPFQQWWTHVMGTCFKIIKRSYSKHCYGCRSSISFHLSFFFWFVGKEKVVGYDSATAFVKALGVRALSDPEDDVGPPVEKERPLDGSAACVFIFYFWVVEECLFTWCGFCFDIWWRFWYLMLRVCMCHLN